MRDLNKFFIVVFVLIISQSNARAEDAASCRAKFPQPVTVKFQGKGLLAFKTYYLTLDFSNPDVLRYETDLSCKTKGALDFKSEIHQYGIEGWDSNFSRTFYCATDPALCLNACGMDSGGPASMTLIGQLKIARERAIDGSKQALDTLDCAISSVTDLQNKSAANQKVSATANQDQDQKQKAASQTYSMSADVSYTSSSGAAFTQHDSSSTTTVTGPSAMDAWMAARYPQ
jgi:hypothetical protein